MGKRLMTSSGILCKKESEPSGLTGGASSGLRGKKDVAVSPMSLEKAPSLTAPIILTHSDRRGRRFSSYSRNTLFS